MEQMSNLLKKYHVIVKTIQSTAALIQENPEIKRSM